MRWYYVCGMPTEDVYSSGHLVISHFWLTYVGETNLSKPCVSGLRTSFGTFILLVTMTINEDQKVIDF